MAKPLRPKRGTTAKNDAFTGLASEITIDTDKHSIRVHDGVTAGGHEILPKAKNDELYLSKSGGTMTGGITFPCGGGIEVNPSYPDELTLRANSELDESTGAFLALRAKDATTNTAGSFMLGARATSTENSCSLNGYIDGTLTWDGNSVITSAGGTFKAPITFNANVDVTATGADEYGVVQYLKDKNGKPAFSFQIAKWGNGGCAFRLIPQTPDGTQLPSFVVERANDNKVSFIGDGKNFERVNSSGKTDSGIWIRYESGFQICAVDVKYTANAANVSVSLPVAFTGVAWSSLTNYSSDSMAGIWSYQMVNSQTIKVSVYHTGNKTDYLTYNAAPTLVCVGFWK